MNADRGEGKAEAMLASVKQYYGQTLQNKDDLKTNVCCTNRQLPATFRKALELVPKPVVNKFYGCGSTIPMGVGGLNIVDLGCGSGRDTYMAAVLVGRSGSVKGIDMTDEQLETARSCLNDFSSTLGYRPNLVFEKGYIEDLEGCGIRPGSVDVFMSNCVVNLSPHKQQVFQQAYQALKDGGEFHFSDIYCSRRLPEAFRNDPVLLGECLAGAFYIHDLKWIAKSAGFEDIRMLSITKIGITDENVKEVIGGAEFWSATFRMFKVDKLENAQEDYGQIAVYKGTIADCPHTYQFDMNHHFESRKPLLVSGNTARILSGSWLVPHFRVTGDRSVHYGSMA